MRTRVEIESDIKAIADDCPLTMPFWLASMLLAECRRQGLADVLYDGVGYELTVKIQDSGLETRSMPPEPRPLRVIKLTNESANHE